MFPNAGAGMPNVDAPVKKRRSRKKKPVALDPEAERQERELRMKIKQSLHTQQVLRTEVEEDEAQRNATTNGRGGGGAQANMGSQQMNNMMMARMAMGFGNNIGNVQPQMGGMGMQRKDKYQFTNDQVQQYDSRQSQGGSGAGANIPNMQQQMQQIKQQLDVQRQQLEEQLEMKKQMELEQQLKMKQQLEMEERLQMKQQMILRQQQVQMQNMQQRQPSPFPPQSHSPHPSAYSPQPQSHFAPRPQRLQSPLPPQNEETEFGAKPSSEEIMRSLKHEQERLFREAKMRAGGDNMGNMSAPQISCVTPVSQYDASAQYQQSSNRLGGQVVLGQSNQQQRDGMTHANHTNRLEQHSTSPSLSAHSNEQQQQQVYPQRGGMARGDYANQQDQRTKDETQCPPGNFQIQAQQSQPYSTQNGTPPTQQSNGEYSQRVAQIEQNPISSQLQCRRNSKDSSITESWLKGSNLDSADLFDKSSLSHSMAFHSVGNMSASFGSETSMGRLETEVQKKNGPNDEERTGGSSKSWGDSEGNLTVSKKSAGGGSTRAEAAGQRGEGNDQDSDQGVTYTDTTVPLQSSGLQPIQENEADDVSKIRDDMILGHSSMVMSVDGEFTQSNLSMTFANSGVSMANSGLSMNFANSTNMNELVMSVDSTTLNALMQQSQLGGEDSLVDSSSSDANPPFPGDESAKPTKRDASDSGGNEHRAPSKAGNAAPSASLLSPASMEDDPPKESDVTRGLSRNLSESSRSRSGRLPRPSLAMMAEISQWTMNNPFEESSTGSDPDPSAAAAPADTAPVGAGGESKKPPQEGKNVQENRPMGPSMGDFHSLGGSIDTMNLSMMSSMTAEDAITESLRALDISNLFVDQRRGK